MSASKGTITAMRAVRFHRYGEPQEVLVQEEVAKPSPGAGEILIAVEACGLNPADWALCRGLFAGDLPRGVGLDVAGRVEAVGVDVSDVKAGDLVFGVPDYANQPSAGLADYAVLKVWSPLPDGLGAVAAASLPMAVETAFRSLESLGVKAGDSVFIHGGGTMVGFAAVQIARRRGARVIASAGETFAGELQRFGAEVTPYGDGMGERVAELAGGAPDLVLDTSPPGRGILPQLVDIAGCDPKRVLTVTDMEAAKELGVRNSFDEGAGLRYDVLGEFADLAAAGEFSVPISRTYPFEEWRTAMEASLAGHARGKLVVLLNAGA